MNSSMPQGDFTFLKAFLSDEKLKLAHKKIINNLKVALILLAKEQFFLNPFPQKEFLNLFKRFCL